MLIGNKPLSHATSLEDDYQARRRETVDRAMSVQTAATVLLPYIDASSPPRAQPTRGQQSRAGPSGDCAAVADGDASPSSTLLASFEKYAMLKAKLDAMLAAGSIDKSAYRDFHGKLNQQFGLSAPRFED